MLFTSAVWAQTVTFNEKRVGNIVVEAVIKQSPTTPLREVIALDFAPDGTIFFIERQGYVNQLNPETGERKELLKLDVFLSKPGGERELGLMGIAVEPGFNFKDKNHIWLYYSPMPENNVMNRLSVFEYKFDENGEPYLDPASEKVIFMVYWDRNWCCHPAGDLRFGPDGKLYLALGDDVDPSASAPHGGYGALDTRPGHERWNALRTAQSPTDLRGKILRLNPDGTIPEDNPFYNDSRYHPAVYQIGFRNPYRFSIDPVTGWMLIGDNNPDATQDNPEKGPKGIAEWNIATAPGQNFGWPYCIGPALPYMNYDYHTGVNHGPFHEICSRTVPAYAWVIREQTWQFPEFGQGGASPIAGVILRRPAPDAKYQWSEELLNHWYLMDFTRGFIAQVKLFDDGTRFAPPYSFYDFDFVAPRDYHQVPPPETEFTRWIDGFSGPTDLRQSPDGALYVVDYGRRFFRANEEAAIYRIYDAAATEAAHKREPLPLGVQEWAIRNAGSTFEERLAVAAAAGYTAIEPYTLPGNLSAEEVKALLDKYGMVIPSAHVGGLDRHLAEGTLGEIAEYFKALGAKQLVWAYANFESAEEWREFGRKLNAIGAELKKYGLEFAYHNHNQEFRVYDGKYAIDYLFEETDPENVKFQLDVGWAYWGGADLHELIQQYAGRITSVHIKDFNAEGQVTHAGLGDLRWGELLNALIKVGGTEWFFTEQDNPYNPTHFAYGAYNFIAPLLKALLKVNPPEYRYSHLPSAVQEYAIRAVGDFEDRLALAAKAGYTGIELFSSPNLSAEELKALLDKYGLKLVSWHVRGLDQALAEGRLAEIAEYHKAVGNQYIVWPSGRGGSAEEWAELGRKLNAIGAELRKHGISFGYHSHSQEFEVFDGKYAIEYLFEQTDPENVFFQLDLGWAYSAGVDLVEIIKKYPGRIKSVHVKDFSDEGQVSVGKGNIDWRTVLAAAKEIGGAEWFITEQDGPPSAEVFAYESAVGLNTVLWELYSR